MQIEQLELNHPLSYHNSPLSSTFLAVTSNLSSCEVPALTWCSPSRQGLTVAYSLLASACFGVQVTSTDGQNQLSGKLVLVRAAQNWGVETLFVYASRHPLDPDFIGQDPQWIVLSAMAQTPHMYFWYRAWYPSPILPLLKTATFHVVIILGIPSVP